MKNEIIVRNMLEHAVKTVKYCENIENIDGFKQNSMLVDACVFNISQIGELANTVDADFAAQHSNIPWRVLYGLRNRIVHNYDGVNLLLILQIIKEDFPQLIENLRAQ